MTIPDFSFEVADVTYTSQTSLALREDLITLRDQALTAGDFASVVVLSHTIAWMDVAITQLRAYAIAYTLGYTADGR